MTLPNFLIIGAAKSGTTSLANYLRQHPEIYLSKIKEPHFFAFEGQSINFCGPGDKKVHQSIVTNLDTYQSLFQSASVEKAIGEASTSSLIVPDAAKRIKKYTPNVKLIAILRNPAERAYSSFLHLRRDGREVTEDFRKALQKEAARIDNNWGCLWRYTQIGFYHQQLKPYYELFDSQQIRVYLYEDLKNNPSLFFKDIFEFLNVDTNFIPNTTIKNNVSGIPKSRLLHNVLHSKNTIRSIIGPLVPKYLRIKLREHNLSKPQLSVMIKNDLLEIFKEDILSLQSLINRDLSHWLN
jgi:hypothetical protein